MNQANPTAQLFGSKMHRQSMRHENQVLVGNSNLKWFLAKLFNKKYQHSFAPDMSKLRIPSDLNCEDTDGIPGTSFCPYFTRYVLKHNLFQAKTCTFFSPFYLLVGTKHLTVWTLQKVGRNPALFAAAFVSSGCLLKENNKLKFEKQRKLNIRD